jgi:hypothetical protein
MKLQGCLLFLVAAAAACGGTVNPGDDAGTDGQSPNDAGSDAGYLACMDSNGQLSDALKTCGSDADCVIKEEQTDCCGTILYVGVSTASASAFDACEAAWVSHFPACGCASNTKETEDGTITTYGADAAAPAVHCTDFTMSGGVCMTYTP